MPELLNQETDALLKEWDALSSADSSDDDLKAWEALDANDQQDDHPLEAFDMLPQEEQRGIMEDILRWGSREVLKPAAQGITGIVDLPASLYNLAAMGVDTVAGTDSFKLPYVSDAVGKGVDYATQGYSEGEPGVLGQGVEFATGMATGGGIAKQGAKTASKFLQKGSKFLGSTDPVAIAGAGAMGATMKGLEDEGALTSIGGGVGANVATHLGAAALKSKIPTKMRGLGPKKLKTEALEAGERQNVNIPNFVATDAKSMALGSQLGSKMPFIGDKMHQNAGQSAEQFLASTKKLGDKIGPAKDDNVRKQIKNLYERSKGFLNDKDQIVPTHLNQEILKIEKEIGEKAIHSPKTKTLVNDLEQLKKNLGMSQFEGQTFSASVPAKNLVSTKQEFNSLIDWEKNTDLPLKYYKDLRASVVKDIEAYGEQNPQFFKAFNKANDFRTKVGKRETFDEKLLNKIGNEKDGVQYGKFVKWAEDPKNKPVLEKTLGTDNINDFKDLITIARAFKDSSKNIPNPSGTASVKMVYKILGSVGAAVTGGIIGSSGDWMSAAQTIGGLVGSGTILNHMLNNKKLLQKAKLFAQKPTDATGKQIINILKSQTNLTTTQLSKAIEKTRGIPPTH